MILWILYKSQNHVLMILCIKMGCRKYSLGCQEDGSKKQLSFGILYDMLVFMLYLVYIERWSHIFVYN